MCVNDVEWVMILCYSTFDVHVTQEKVPNILSFANSCICVCFCFVREGERVKEHEFTSRKSNVFVEVKNNPREEESLWC